MKKTQHKNINPDTSLLNDVFIQFSEIQAVYLFGSQISGKTHIESDLDIAIYPGTINLKEKKLDILTALAEQGFCHVDVVFLDEKDIVLNYEAIRSHCVIYSKASFNPGVVFSRIAGKYLDFSYYLKVQRDAMKTRILNGQS